MTRYRSMAIGGAGKKGEGWGENLTSHVVSTKSRHTKVQVASKLVSSARFVPPLGQSDLLTLRQSHLPKAASETLIYDLNRTNSFCIIDVSLDLRTSNGAEECCLGSWKSTLRHLYVGSWFHGRVPILMATCGRSICPVSRVEAVIFSHNHHRQNTS